MDTHENGRLSTDDPNSRKPSTIDYLLTPVTFLNPEWLVQYPPWVGHIPFAFWIIDAVRPRCLVELGTASGNSYCAFLQAIKVLGIETQCFGVDHWQGDPHSSFYSGDEMLANLTRHHDPRYATFSTLLQKTFDDALGEFADGIVDLLHIDGYHTYEAVRHDFDSWLPKVSDRGVVLFHDTAVRRSDFGVWRFWDEIRTKYPSFSFLHSHGLGVAYVGSQPMPAALGWLLEQPSAIAPARRYFAGLGRGVLDRFLLQEEERQRIALTEHYKADTEARVRERDEILRQHHAESERIRVERDEILRQHRAESERIRAERDEIRDEVVAARALKDTQISDLARALAAQENEKAALREIIRAREDRITAIGMIAAARTRLVEEQRAKAQNQDALLERFNTAERYIEQLKQLLTAYHSSTSWRLTRPLRVVMRIAKGELTLRGAFRQRQALRAAAKATVAESAAPSAPQTSIRGTCLVTHPVFARNPLPNLDISVSVVIPTYNAGTELVWLLRKLSLQQGLRSIEIVVVDSSSTDGTAALAAASGCRVVPIRKEEFSHSYARNLGAQHATGEYLLFMTQDAYPIGDRWLYGMAQALTRPLPDGQFLSAVSCAEYNRTDSDLLYDSLLHGHYEFLRCGDRDRVGRLTTTDQQALRQQGQLSDVACMIRRALFHEYGYHGNYAEDLTLGIKLIKDGHQIAMLSSIRVIHSHRRPASYFLKRVFVDVVFLIAIFPDHPIPTVNSVTGSLMAAIAIRRALRPILPSAHISPAAALQALVVTLRSMPLPELVEPLQEDGLFGCAPLTEWIASLNEIAIPTLRQPMAAEIRSAEQMRALIVEKIQNLADFAGRSYSDLDEDTAAELNEVTKKAIAMQLGAMLAFCYLSPAGNMDNDDLDLHIRKLKPLLSAGI